MEIYKKEILLFSVLGIVLLLFFLLPQNIKDQSLILNADHPTLLSAFFSNYVHSTFNHFISNFGVFIILAILFVAYEHDVKRFFWNNISILFIAPFALYIVFLWSYPQMSAVFTSMKTSQGFSGLLGAFGGYFLVLMYYRLKEINKLELKSPAFLFFLMINFSIICISNQLQSLILPILVITIIVGLLSWKAIRDVTLFLKISLMEWIHYNRKANFISRCKSVFIPLFAILFLFYLPLSVPIEWITGGGIINKPLHYFGYFFGIISTFGVIYFLRMVESLKR
jgi:hypothetical protein